MSEAFLRDVLGRTWKGNARELRSYLEEAVVLSEAGILDAPEVALGVTRLAQAGESEQAFLPLNAMIEDAEPRRIRTALDRAGGSVIRSSKLLGISRQTLWEKMKKLRIGHEAAADADRP